MTDAIDNGITLDSFVSGSQLAVPAAMVSAENVNSLVASSRRPYAGAFPMTRASAGMAATGTGPPLKA